VRNLKDDFGRVVATISPDSGTASRLFDEADRLVAGTDALGNRAAYEYDPAGRIARQTITDKRSGQAGVTVWRYQDKRLVALEHPAQSEQYRYDERGLLAAKTVKVKRNDGSELASVTRYAYGEDGTLQSASLSDGSRIDYERNGQGQVTALKRSRIQTGWLQWVLPSQTLVSDIQRSRAGAHCVSQRQARFASNGNRTGLVDQSGQCERSQEPASPAPTARRAGCAAGPDSLARLALPVGCARQPAAPAGPGRPAGHGQLRLRPRRDDVQRVGFDLAGESCTWCCDSRSRIEPTIAFPHSHQNSLNLSLFST
jgi:YD repeat-containing protein